MNPSRSAATNGGEPLTGRSRRIRSRTGARLRAAVAAVLLISLAGCGPVDQAIADLEQAITAIEAAPGDWGSTASSLIDKLHREGSEFASEVQGIVNQVEGQTINYLYCSTDFFGSRMADALQNMLHRLDPSKPAPVLRPVVCNTNPPASVTSGKDTLVTFYGYNLTSYEKQTQFVARVEYDDGQVALAKAGAISVATPYQMSLDIQAVDFTKLDRSRGPKLIVRWGDAAVTSYGGGQAALPVLIPVPKKPALSHLDFVVEKYAAPGGVPFVPGHCTPLDTTYPVLPEGWIVDVDRGDPYHPGMAEIPEQVGGNRQGTKSLRAYNYQAISVTKVKVTGRICGDSGTGPGAIFDRGYRVFTKEAS